MATAKQQDFTTMMTDMMGAFPVDSQAFQDAFKTQSSLAEKLSAVNIDAAQKSTELSAKWTQDTLKKMSEMTKAKAEPTDYAKSMTDFASAYAESAAEHMAAYAEIAKTVQSQTMELMLSAGKDMSEDMTKAAKKATDDATAAAKKTGAATK